MTDQTETRPDEPAMFAVTRGDPEPDELAALTTVLLACAAPSGQPHEDHPPSGWAAYWRSVGAPLAPGPGSWQAAVRDR